MKKNQSGYFIVLGILLVIIVGGVLFGSIFLIKRSDKPKQSESTSTFQPTVQKEETKKVELSKKEKLESQDIEVKNHLFSISGGLAEYQANNNGKLPLLSSQIDNFNSDYVAILKHPANNKSYSLVQTVPKDQEILYLVGRICKDDESGIQTTDGSRHYILQTKLPSGALYCVDNV